MAGVEKGIKSGTISAQDAMSLNFSMCMTCGEMSAGKDIISHCKYKGHFIYMYGKEFSYGCGPCGNAFSMEDLMKLSMQGQGAGEKKGP